MSGFELAGRRVLVAGVSNRKSVGWYIGERLVAEGAAVAWVVHTKERRDQIGAKLPGGGPVFVCDVADEAAVERLGVEVRAGFGTLHGFVHSIAHGNYSRGAQPFHRTVKSDFLAAVDVSCFSLVALCGALEPHFEPDTSVVAISISTTRMAAENYGYMAPIKAALDSAVIFLAKSLGSRGEVRVNGVKAGLLKTASSAGIPGYLESYLFAEQVIPRKRGLETREAADVALFLLSPRSSGINGQGLVVDAGMEWNHFDKEIVERATRPPQP